VRHVTFRRKPRENPREAAMYHILDYIIISTSTPRPHTRVLPRSSDALSSVLKGV